MLKKCIERMDLSKKFKSLEMLSANEKLFLEEYVEDNRELLKTLSKM